MNSSSGKTSKKNFRDGSMALRTLDNTPEHTPERPKKAPKKLVCAGIENSTAGNDENTASGNVRSPAIEKAPEDRVDYIASADLQPLKDPEMTAQNLLQRLESKDWIKVCEALNDVRRLAIYHSDSLTSILDRVLLLLVKAMKNPRSALCKTSIITSTDLFNGFGHLFLPPMSDVIDTLLLQLLLKASQDKRFVCEEAEMALNAMVKSSPALPLLRRLEHYVNHSNLRVRAKAALSISNCITKLEVEPMKEYGFSQILHIAADLLNDRLPIARDSARRIIASVHAAFSKDHGQDGEEGQSPEESWKSFCATSLPPIAAQAVEKIVQQQ